MLFQPISSHLIFPLFDLCSNSFLLYWLFSFLLFYLYSDLPIVVIHWFNYDLQPFIFDSFLWSKLYLSLSLSFCLKKKNLMLVFHSCMTIYMYMMNSTSETTVDSLLIFPPMSPFIQTWWLCCLKFRRVLVIELSLM